MGCGFIGETLAKAIEQELSPHLELVAVFDGNASVSQSLAEKLRTKPEVVRDADEMFAHKKVELVIEAASQAAARSYIPKALAAGKHVMTMSVGALADREFYDEVTKTAKAKKLKVLIPSGAIGGLDWIRSASRAGLDSVSITVRKPPRGLEGAPYVVEHKIDLKAIKTPTQIYEGKAAEAVTAFPANVNVAAALSLAGIGVERTTVRVIADPTVERNVHEITAEGPPGRLHVTVENVPAPTNPKTSWVAALSAIQKLSEIEECPSSDP